MRYATAIQMMKERGITQAEAARVAGITDRSLRNKLEGRTPLTVEEALSIWREFFRDIPIVELFKGG